MNTVCCIGILVADITVSPVSKLPRFGTIDIVNNISLSIGGCAANTAIDLAKLGVSAAVVGKVGNDMFGDYLLSQLESYGIETRGIARSADTVTSSAIVTVSPDGERAFMHCRGGNGNFSTGDIDLSVVDGSDYLIIGGSLLLPAFDGQPTADILRHAREHGVYTVLDVAWDDTGRWMDCVAPCLPHLDLFIPSIDEARILSGKDDVREMADLFLERGAKLCVIKMGGDGCYVRPSDGEGFFSSSFKNVNVVDTNGAGDSFVAGFITGLSRGMSLEACAEFANAVGAHCITQPSTTAGVCSYDETVRFIRDYGKREV